MLPLIPEQHREALKFDDLWPAFGGKFAHWHDYVQDYGTRRPHNGAELIFISCSQRRRATKR